MQDLQVMIGGQFREALPEWLTLAFEKRLRFAHENLVEALDFGRRFPEFRDGILPLIGVRGRWLAAQNPDWKYALKISQAEIESASEEEIDEEIQISEIWLTGTKEERSLLLHQLRKGDPSYARELVEDTWTQDSPEERAAFLQLSKDADRDHFVEEFWRRRDPARTFSQNEFKEEHYRRLAYANTHFAAGIAGYRTDRGRIFILHGPPDVVRHQLYGGSGIPRAEFWRYKSIPEFAGEIELKFVDGCICGDYRLETLPKE